MLSNLPDGHSRVAVPLPAVEIPPESLVPLPEDDPQGWEPQEFSNESRPNVRRHCLRTFSLVQGRPSTNLDALDAEIPQPFSSLNDNMSTFTVRDGYLVQNTDPNDEEGVAFYIDLIKQERAKDQILRGQPMGDPRALTQRQYGSKTEIVSYWRLVS